MAAGKLAWMGIPHLTVPSFHTSTTDVRHGVVDKGQRRGDVFTARVDRVRMHADVHAAAVIGLWAFLVPKPTLEEDPKPKIKPKVGIEQQQHQQQEHQQAPVAQAPASKTIHTYVRRPLFVPSVVQAFGKGSPAL